MARPRKRKRQEPGFSTQAHILLGAAEAFGAKGYADTTVEDVLEAAGVSRRTFYKLFRNKDELFVQLFETASMLFMQSTRTAAALGKTPEDKLANCIEVWLRAPQTAGPVFHVMQVEARRPGSPLAERRERVLDELVDMFSEGIEQNRGARVDPLLLRGLIAALEHVSWHLHNRTEATEDDIAHAKRVMLQIAGSVLDEAMLAKHGG